MSMWIDQQANDIKSYSTHDRGVVSWSGTLTIASLTEYGIGLEAFEKFKVGIIIYRVKSKFRFKSTE